MNRWKALAGATIVAALVIAPMAAGGAFADEPLPSNEVIVAEVAEPVIEASAVATEQSQPEMICDEGGYEPKVNTTGNPATVTVTAPEGFLIDAYCVKAGTTKVIVPVDPPAAEVTIDHPDKDSVSHFQVHLIPIPDDEPTTVTATYSYTPPTCDADGVLSLGSDAGYHWEAVLNDNGTTTYTAVANDEYVLAAPVSFSALSDLTQLEGPYCEVGPNVVIPSSPAIHDQCGTEEDEYGLPADTDEIEYVFFEGSIHAHIIVDDTVFGALPSGWVLNDDGTATWVGTEGDFTDEPCTEVYPVPAQFSAPPTAPTCTDAAVFSTAFLGDNVIEESEDGLYKEYDFENVIVGVDRTVSGEVTLFIWAKEGYVLTGLSDEWDVTDGWYAVRTIPLPAATGYQDDDPEAPCFLAGPVTLSPPIVVDECGIENDSAELPANTAGVVYSWVAEEDPDNLDVLATVQEGYDVGDVPAGWTDNLDGTYTFAWTYVFTDEDCPLIPGAIGSQCVGSVPYLGYDVTLPEGFVADSATPVTITFVHPTDPSQNYVVTNQPLSGTLLWPGASAATPQQWPGWVLNSDGTYSETDGNFAWTRAAAGITVRFEVNPTYETTVVYPPESALCANPGDPAALAVTGGVDMTPWGAAAALMLLAGAALLVSRRFARS